VPKANHFWFVVCALSIPMFACSIDSRTLRSAGAGGSGGTRGTGGTGGQGPHETNDAGDAGPMNVTACTGSPPPSALISDFEGAVVGVCTAAACGTNVQGQTEVFFGMNPGISGGTFTYASTGLTFAAVSLAAGGAGSTGQSLRVIMDSGTSVAFGYDAVGLYFDSCVDASAYSGVTFTITGDLGACDVQFAMHTSENEHGFFGACTATDCHEAMVSITTGTTTVLFSQLVGGSPLAYVDKTKIIGMHWQFQVPSGGSCDANFTVDNVSFVE
jgi:hypothetical protein